MAGIADKFDKAYEEKPIAELADAPVALLQGVSDSDAEHLKAAFNIKTVRDWAPTSTSCGRRRWRSSPSRRPRGHLRLDPRAFRLSASAAAEAERWDARGSAAQWCRQVQWRRPVSAATAVTRPPALMAAHAQLPGLLVSTAATA